MDIDDIQTIIVLILAVVAAWQSSDGLALHMPSQYLADVAYALAADPTSGGQAQ